MILAILPRYSSVFAPTITDVSINFWKAADDEKPLLKVYVQKYKEKKNRLERKTQIVLEFDNNILSRQLSIR